ncbi:hypothetical protein A2Z33_05410 [Candidatus Gottesmanbacteria bacterium RBG_16_52_11]|uniref:2-oxoglutarate dehydrogenase n=1 Tax=Candidatus Gottesmanbacteria bacterium RBG_16_52_11 TaxID=1798374 RepID=A0A1F5YWB5_9BACT|nr:MAG: hypothetical protein A2Z33_05410 [Candidatus Gottesmanbacteria bacterium RBG_16_52_11]
MTAAIARNARVLALTVVLTATSGSLFYSEVLKYNPCLLCWYQRIFMYPQTVLLGLGILKNDRHVADYSLAFSLIGGIIAAFHYWGQVSASSILPCPVVGFSASCSQRFSLEYGYITIPMMSLTAFTLIGALMVIYRLRKSR